MLRGPLLVRDTGIRLERPLRRGPARTRDDVVYHRGASGVASQSPYETDRFGRREPVQGERLRSPANEGPPKASGLGSLRTRKVLQEKMATPQGVTMGDDAMAGTGESREREFSPPPSEMSCVSLPEERRSCGRRIAKEAELLSTAREARTQLAGVSRSEASVRNESPPLARSVRNALLPLRPCGNESRD